LEEFTLIKYTGASVDILCKINPECTKLVVIENRTKVLYLRLLKALLYGCCTTHLHSGKMDDIVTVNITVTRNWKGCTYPMNDSAKEVAITVE